MTAVVSSRAHHGRPGRLLEIGPGDLSLSQEDAAALLRAAEVTLGGDDVAALHRRTEGWAAGLYLAALYLKEGGPLGTAAVSFGGDDRLVSEYMEAEFLARISARHRAFLTRTAVLERMCGSLCEAMLEQPGSAATLTELAHSNLLLVPLDRRSHWYRYHHLFRDMLLAELERLEPGLLPVLRRRAAGWCLANGRPEEALEYSIAAEDVDEVARLVETLALPAFRQARLTTLQRWFGWLDARGGIEPHRMVAVWASVLAATAGRSAEAERWADVVDRWEFRDETRPDDPGAEAWAAVLRALVCRRGVKQMLADADEAVRRFGRRGSRRRWPGPAGDSRCSFPAIRRALTRASRRCSVAAGTSAPPMSWRTPCASGRSWPSRGVTGARPRPSPARHAYVSARPGSRKCSSARCKRGSPCTGETSPAARRELVSAQRLRSFLTYVFPHLAVQARLELIRVHLALADMAGARTLMREIDEILKRRPGPGHPGRGGPGAAGPAVGRARPGRSPGPPR